MSGKISVHIEYLENWSRGLDVTWQLVRGDLTVHPWTVTLPWGLSVGSETPLTELVYCVTYNDRPSRSALSRHCACPFYSSRAGFFFFGKTSHYPGLSAPWSPDLAPCDFWLFPKLKSPLKWRLVDATVTQYTSRVNGVSLPT